MMQTSDLHSLKKRFRGFLPVVIDVETGGFNAQTDALLELAAVVLEMNDAGEMILGPTLHYHIEPFAGANIEARALEFTGIIVDHPFRFAVSEKEALTDLCTQIRQAVKKQHCQKAVLVGHNSFFDLSFLQAALTRAEVKKIPFHSFTTFDTACLSAVCFGQTVLAKAVHAAGLKFDQSQAHSALYDATITAELFCAIVNHWQAYWSIQGMCTKYTFRE